MKNWWDKFPGKSLRVIAILFFAAIVLGYMYDWMNPDNLPELLYQISNLVVAFIFLVAGFWLQTWYQTRQSKMNNPVFSYSFEEVGKELRVLNAKIKKFDPDFIIGITGGKLVGGCIVAAWLASNAFCCKPESFYTIDRDNPLPEDLKREIIKSEKRRILLVDDESGDGSTIQDQIKKFELLSAEITKKKSEAKEQGVNLDIKDLNVENAVRFAVIIVRSTSWANLEKQENGFWEEKNFWVYPKIVDGHNPKWPWYVLPEKYEES
jgi:hypoxanthine phosphoribosyltransferase